MKTLLFTLLLLILTGSIVLGQSRFSKKDFMIGRIGIDEPVDSAIQELGQPQNINSVGDEEVGEFEAYHFDGINIWTVNETGKISSFDISTPKLATSRGLRVGDSVKRLERLYGKGYSEKEFERSYDIYDKSFTDFTECRMYEYRQSDNNVFWAIFFIKASKVVKIYLYRGLEC